MIGKTISHYKIIEKLDEGGMGVVYKAEDTKLKRTVALKFLKPEALGNEEQKTRFVYEAQAASALDHPNICNIHGIDETEAGQMFIAMTFYEGETLRKKIARGMLPIEEAIDIAIQIAQGLAKTHERGIVHRDINSSNIMVTNDGVVKIMDFGLAKISGTPKITKTGTTLGTIAYMSPEQVRGDAVDHRTDLWSLGVMLYEMLTGHLPFQGLYESAMMYSILNVDPEPVTKHRPELSSGFQHLLDRALEKDYDGRYQSMQELLIELRRLKQDSSKVSRKAIAEMPQAKPLEHPAPTSPAVHLRKRSYLLTGSLAFVALVVVFAYLFWWGKRVPAVPDLTNPTQVTTAIGMEDYPTWSPDGRLIAYHSNQSGNWDIWVTQVGEGTPINLTADYTGNDQFPSWSPDGKQIAFMSDRDGWGCYVMSSLGRSIRKIVRTPGAWYQPQWSSDGQELAFVVGDFTGFYIEIVSLNTGTSQRFPLPGRGDEYPGYDLSWSPDGRYFAYCVAALAWRDSPNSQLWVLRVADGVGFPVTDGKTTDWSPQWSHDGSILYFVSNRGGTTDLWQQRLRDDGTPAGSPQNVTTGLEIWYAKFCPKGNQLVYSRGRMVGNVWRVPILEDRPATWADAQQVTFEQATIYDVDVSPDGKRLVFDSERDGKRHLWIMLLESGELKRVTTDPREKIMPKWSPDGREIAFFSAIGGNRDIYTVPTDGGPVRRLTNHEAGDRAPVWSHDGQEIAFYSNRSGNWEIWIIPAEGGEARQVTAHPASDMLPDWSPDGQWLLFLSDRTGEYRTWKVPAAGGNPRPVTEGGVMQSVWSRDGKKVYFLANRDGAWNFWGVPAEGGAERQMTDLPVPIGWSGGGFYGGFIGPSTDGKYIYFIYREDLGDLWVMDVIEYE